MNIGNCITISGNIFFKINMHGTQYIKLIPDYDAKYGVVLRVIEPPHGDNTLDKKWIKLQKDSESCTFKRPSFLSEYIGSEIETYEDEFGSEICRIRIINSQFNMDVKKTIYEPFFLNNKINISYAYARENFPVKKDLYVSFGVINKKNMIYVFGGGGLNANENAAKLLRFDVGFVSKALMNLPDDIELFKYRKCHSNNSILTILMEKANEKSISGNGRCLSGIRERAIRARRIRGSAGRITPFRRG